MDGPMEHTERWLELLRLGFRHTRRLGRDANTADIRVEHLRTVLDQARTSSDPALALGALAALLEDAEAAAAELAAEAEAAKRREEAEAEKRYAIEQVRQLDLATADGGPSACSVSRWLAAGGQEEETR